MSPRIKVLQLGSPTGLYGAERWILALIKYLDPTKIDSYVSVVKDDPYLEAPLCIEADKLGFNTYIIDSYGRINRSGIRRLREFIIHNGIDLIHTHGYKTDIIGLLAVLGTSCKILSTPHGWTKQPDWKLRFYEVLDRMVFPLFDAIVPLSDSLYNALRLIPGIKNKLHLIENGVDLEEVRHSHRIAGDISALKADGGFVIGYIGRLTQGKGLDVLLTAAARYGEPDWRIAIVGDGEQQAELLSMAKKLGINDRVTFLGFQADRLAFLRGFDIFVLPSRSEGTPRSLMEAMIAGIPVVASDIAGCRSLVDDKVTGLLFQPDNSFQLANSMKELRSNPLLRMTFSQKGQEFIEKKFSARRMARDYEELYLNLSKKTGRNFQKGNN